MRHYSDIALAVLKGNPVNRVLENSTVDTKKRQRIAGIPYWRGQARGLNRKSGAFSNVPAAS
jgi:hypothetical protein